MIQDRRQRIPFATIALPFLVSAIRRTLTNAVTTPCRKRTIYLQVYTQSACVNFVGVSAIDH